jgi:aryl-alcohol dehydrogenase-like predicted oxidoreductase
MPSRRDFLAMSKAYPLAAAGVWSGLGSGRSEASQKSPPSGGDVPKKPGPGAPGPGDVQLPPGATMPTRKLGRTGVAVSLLGLGGFHIGIAKNERTAIEIVRTAIDHGVSFLDNCWDYNDGRSQEWMGNALREGYRQRTFLMTKIDGRTRAAAASQIDQCLRSLQTDVIDLVQIHEVIRTTDPDRVFGADGAIEALLAARKAGKLRFIGFTGHKSPDIHLKMLETASAHGFRFDTVQMPLNVMDAHYQSFERRVLPVLVEREIGVLGMKPLGSGLFFKSQPLAERAITPTDCLHYAMSLPTSVVITGCDTVGILKQGLAAAYSHRPLAPAEKVALLDKTRSSAADGGWEGYKTSQTFDGTAKHPWWLDSASIAR